MSKLFGGMAIGIGSMPHKEMSDALDLIFEYTPDAPHWPQLQAVNYTEKFIAQATEGMPCITHVPEKGDVFVDAADGCADGLVEFYEKFMSAEQSGDWSDFAISQNYGSGIYAYADYLNKNDLHPPVVKMQLVGPVSFPFTLNDQNGKAIIYNPDLYDVSSKLLAAKARWQMQFLGERAESLLYFFDEPSMSVFGSSAMITISSAEVTERFNEITRVIKDGGGMVGVHVCGKTDWSILLDGEVDLINWDAYVYGDSMQIYADKLGPYLERGGRLAFGIVPTSPAIDEEDADTLSQKLEGLLSELAPAAGVSRAALGEATIITSSCGCGTLSIAQTEKVYQIMQSMQSRFRV